MRRILGLLLLCAGLAVAQEGKEDDSGIEVDSSPSGPEEPAGDPAKAPPKERTTAFPAREPGKKVETVEIKRKKYSFTVPADWVLHDEEKADVELSFELLLPGSSKRGGLQLGRHERLDPRSFPYYQAEWFRKEKPDYKVEVFARPSPHVVVQTKWEDTDWVNAYFSLSVKNNVFTLELSCDAADFPQAKADLLATVRSFKADVEIWPPIPKGYETSQEGIWLIARAPTVTASINPIVKALKDSEKRFRREHGALPKSDAPIVVLMLASRADAAKLEPHLNEATFDFNADVAARRLFVVPLAKDDVDQESILAGAAADVLFFAKYGDIRPDWISCGERILSSAEVRTGKALPNLDEGYLAWYSTIHFHKVSELDALEKSDGELWSHECFFYVAALREGKYKKQYKAFLDDFEETGDGLGAYERNLASIGEADLITATDQYVRTRVKEQKRKHEHENK